MTENESYPDIIPGRDDLALEESADLKRNLVRVLCCVNCFQLPKDAVYQCSEVHLICAHCLSQNLADARINDELAFCFDCEVEIAKATTLRNTAVENVIRELPINCRHCGIEFPRNAVAAHESECDHRMKDCKFSRIGCGWCGVASEASNHENSCSYVQKSGAEIMRMLPERQKFEEERTLHTALLRLLSSERVSFQDLQLKSSCELELELMQELLFESGRFAAGMKHWIVKAKVDSADVGERCLRYQLVLKTKTKAALNMDFFVLRGPFGDMKVRPVIYHHDFTYESNASAFYHLPLCDAHEFNRVVTSEMIKFRLFMCIASKEF